MSTGESRLLGNVLMVAVIVVGMVAMEVTGYHPFWLQVVLVAAGIGVFALVITLAARPKKERR